VHFYEPEIKRQSTEYHQKCSYKKKRLGQETSWLPVLGAHIVLLTWSSLNLGPHSTLQHSEFQTVIKKSMEAQEEHVVATRRR
jgi:hypothetical protein